MSLPSSTLAVAELRRPCVSYAPTIWGDTFLQHASQSKETDDNMKQQAEKLKEKVKSIFQSSLNQNIVQKLNFIDSIQRLGVSYHFQREINQALEQIYNTFTKHNTINEDGDYHFIALLFRLLRQQGYGISSDVFKKFKNGQGSFNETLANDVQGLCSLYEASHLRISEDDVLEEACDFSKTKLKSLVKQLSPSVAAQINHCLRRPFYRSVPRFEIRHYMTLFEQDPSHNETLLNFAKVDFNLLQKLHNKEIGHVTKWRKDSNFVTLVPYARDRLVESYIWCLAISYKPEYSNARTFVGKLIQVICLLDDTYDAYGTVQELELFTKAIQRWDISHIRSLPECMKVVFETVLQLCEEIELLTRENGKSSFVVPHFKQAVSNLTKGYMVEAKWCHEHYIPTYEEYKANGVLTSCFSYMITSFISLAEFATESVLDWIFSDPSIINAASVIGRVMDDMASHKFEQQRVHVASAVECCMKQYSISEAEAYNFIHKDVEDCWKVINEECIKSSDDIPKCVLDCAVNLARISEVSYENHEDKYTNAKLLKDYVSSLLVDPVSIDQEKLTAI
ncbi:probable terpene synthase 2 [Vigna radiata var. radiata]|uniref:Probable terpene synthase 2 n=1 Tax=Vigna radiata var. radiata TaxID=3916 RepID=A0A1S3VVB2_VIGRR|nr:probable terpene synthase 2 [Vigna radiata var. radiata]